MCVCTCVCVVCARVCVHVCVCVCVCMCVHSDPKVLPCVSLALVSLYLFPIFLEPKRTESFSIFRRQ